MTPATRAGDPLDAAVVGGGPAGLSAALWLARYRRRTRVYDAHRPRNAATYLVHGYPGVPDATPESLRRRIRDQALGAGAEIVAARVVDVQGSKDRFRIGPDGAPPAHARRLLLAFGRRDVLPDVPGIRRWFGRFVFHCPDCDGPSVAGARVGVIGRDRYAASIAVLLCTWTDQVILFTHGGDPELPEAARGALARAGIAVESAPIARVVGEAGRGRGLRLEHGRDVPLDAVFSGLRSVPAAALADRLGCRVNDRGEPATDQALETSVPGVYAAGDLIGHPHLAVSAAAEGVRAALALHRSLLPPAIRL